MSGYSAIEVVTYVLLGIPLVAAASSALIQPPNLREGITLTLSAAFFINVLNLFFLAVKGLAGPVTLAVFENGLSIEFLVDPLGVIFAMISSFLWFVTSLYSIGYMRANAEAHQGRFYAFFALAIFAALVIAMAGNLLTVFIGYELLTLSTFPLVIHHGTPEARKAGRVYLAILLSTSLTFFAVAVIWTWLIAGTTDFTVGGILKDKCPPAIAGVLLALYVFGVAKAAIMPVHRWLPAAMVAPSPVSALLHAVAVVKAGVFVLIKILIYVFGLGYLRDMIGQNWWAGAWLTYLSGTTILLASVMALRQDNLKRMLAYSTISQLSYIIMAASLLSSFGMVAASFNIVAHAFGKISLFFAAGAIATASGRRNISQLAGIGWQMPWTMGAFSVGAFSMVGIPLVAGFVGKLYLLLGVVEARHWFALSVVIISTFLSAAYYLPVILKAFAPASKKPARREAPFIMLVAMMVTASATVALFLFPDIFLWLGSLLVE
jgi:multicomponent Na+:H+ antiporter subunit D